MEKQEMEKQEASFTVDGTVYAVRYAFKNPDHQQENTVGDQLPGFLATLVYGREMAARAGYHIDQDHCRRFSSLIEIYETSSATPAALA